MAQRGVYPRRDADFSIYINSAGPYLQAEKDRLKVSDSDLDVFGNQLNEWNILFPDSLNPDKRTQTITQKKNKQRKAIEAHLRKILRDIPQSLLTVTDRNTLRLKDRDHKPTASKVAGRAPGIEMEEIVHLRHKLRFLNPFDPDRRQIPDQQKIFLEVGIGPANAAEENIVFSRLHMISRYLKIISFTEAEAGQTAYYRARYQNTREEQGPPSEVFSAVIA